MSNKAKPTETSKEVDKRVERSKANVLAETHRQLVMSGVGGVSIDEISRRSGVAKTTIYRHWPSRAALLIEACSRMGSAPEPPDSGDTRADLRQLLVALARQLEHANWSAVYPSIVDAAEREGEIRDLQAALHRGFMAPIEVVLERGRSRGDVASGRLTPDLVAMLVGPLFYRRWFSREKIDARWVDGLVDTALGDVPAAGASSARGRARRP